MDQPIDSPAPPPLVAKPAAPPKMFGIDIRYVPPIFITLILLVGHFTSGILESPRNTLLAIGTAIGVEFVLSRLFTGKWPHFASAYITGISVGILVRSPNVWPYALCAAIAITSKYVLRVRDRHIWNPSNFGICALLFLAHDSVASLSVQFSNSTWALVVIWIVGSVIIWRLKRFHITLTYVASFIVFAFLRGPITHLTFRTEVSAITGAVYQLFIFFMITDPKTTVHGKKAQMLVAFFVALVDCLLRLTGSFYHGFFEIDAPYFALFTVGPIANLVDIMRTPPKPAPPQVASAPAG